MTLNEQVPGPSLKRVRRLFAGSSGIQKHDQSGRPNVVAPRVHRAASILVAAALLAACGDVSPTPAPTPGATAASPEQTPTPAASASRAPSPSPTPMAALPGDIASMVDAIVGSADPSVAVDQTRRLLISAGLGIEGDASSANPPSGLVVSAQAVTTMAFEAQGHGGPRTTLAELGQMLDAVAAAEEQGAVAATPAPSVPPGLGDYTFVPSGNPGRWSVLLTEWIGVAIAGHDPADPHAVAVTSPVLAVAAIAARRNPALDLRAPFRADELRLGSLDVVLLLAGMRTAALVGGPAYEAASTGVPSGIVFAEAGPCGQLREHLSEAARAAADAAGWLLGEGLKHGLEQVVEHGLERVGSHGARWAKSVGPIFNAAAVLFRLWSLAVLYNEDNIESKVEVFDATQHKPIGQPGTMAATITVGVPEERWRALKREQARSPLYQFVSECARAANLPVPPDLLSIGSEISKWHVAWRVTRGLGSHLEIPISEFVAGGTGRIEHSLSAQGESMGTDTLALRLLPEKQSDHPGTEVEDTVEVCGRVRTDEPPNVKWLLDAAIGGATKSLSTLAVPIVEILAGMAQQIFTIDACGTAKVTYHVPIGGTWRGTIRVDADRQRLEASGGRLPTGQFEVNYERRSNHVVDEYYLVAVGGDPAVPQTLWPLNGQMFVHGAEHVVMLHGLISRGFTHPGTKPSILLGCDYTESDAEDLSGDWTRNGDGAATITILPDGQYTIAFYPDPNLTGDPPSVTGLSRHVYSPEAGIDCYLADDSSRETASGVLSGVATFADAIITGQLHVDDPGNRLQGSSVFYFEGGSARVTWDFMYSGAEIPIPRPASDGG